MEKLYVEMHDDYITSVSTVQYNPAANEVYLPDGEMLDIEKLQGYKINSIDPVVTITFDQKKYDEYIAKKEKERAIKDGINVMKDLVGKYILSNATDSEAYSMRYLYDPWESDTQYEVGDRRLCKENLYICKQTHISKREFTPDLIPAIWDIINASEEMGTLDNPIPIPELFSSMAYVKGEYYLESGKIYLMNREGMKDGDSISLTFKPSQLVGHYFKIVEKP